VLAAVSVAAVCVAGAVLSTGARAATSPTTVTVTIRYSGIVFAPSYAPAGKLVLAVLNRTTGARDFGVGAQRTGAIAGGRSARLTVTLPAQGERTFTSVATGRLHRITGALDLFEPCRHPAPATVDVSLTKSGGGLTLSPTTVPCGTVTFAVTDVDEAGASLLCSIAAPPQSVVTNQLGPGGTATLTLRSAAKAVVECDAVEDDGNGDSLVVGYASLTLS
jgi:hypothetical protein